MDVGLTELAAAREQLKQIVADQSEAIRHFHEPGTLWFRVNSEQRLAEDADRDQPRHLTTTATCLEALIEGQDRDEAKRATEELKQYASLAFEKSKWSSDGAAWVYCRVRTLKVISTHADLGDADTFDNVVSRLEEAWRPTAASTTGGLRESTDDVAIDPLDGAPSHAASYPPNAYLTYHGALALDRLRRSDRWLGKPSLEGTWAPRKRAAVAWLRQSLAEQVTFQYSASAHRDPQQLAWALCALVRFTPPHELAHVTSEAHDLLVAGIRAFFEQQTASGDWPLGRPLFHYPNAGNAYCYTYETLAELLTLATLSDAELPAAVSLRAVLRRHAPELLAALNRAEETRQMSEGHAGWSSGHHVHRLAPESWATASVFRFLQALRRLVGMWSRDEAARSLGARRISAGHETLAARGDTWNLGRGSVGAQLGVTFVNPVLQKNAESEGEMFVPDPDETIFDGEHARSAILFGPPGTGKTTLVEAVALALDWDFVEVTPAQFLGRGVDFVSAHADELFRKVMELDRCVVLLDELDELIQQRDDSAESIERFFTTTMLPRLAKLWKSGRVLFFANTNGVLKVDPAVRRSQRFDAAILVLTPGYNTKKKYLLDRGIQLDVTQKEFNLQLTGSSDVPQSERELGWFPLARWDQMSILVDGATAIGETTQSLGKGNLKEPLIEIGKALRQLDWPKDKVNGESTDDGVPTRDVAQQQEAERRDPKMIRLARYDPKNEPLAAHLSVIDGERTGFVPIPAKVLDLEGWAKGIGAELAPDGTLRLP